MPLLHGDGRTEEVSEYEAQCLKAGFLAVDDPSQPGDVMPSPGVPVGTGPEHPSKWDLIDRLLTRLRGGDD